MTNSFSFTRLLQLIRPVYLLGGALLYALGAGVAHYLGNTIDWQVYILGQACITLLQLTTIFLKEYFEALERVASGLTRRRDDQKDPPGEDYHLTPPVALAASASVLTFGAIFTALLYRTQNLTVEGFVILGVSFIVAFFYAAPPARLVNSGYGELVIAILMTNLIPALGFLLQVGQLHHLIAMVTFPLTPLYLAMTLAMGLPSYGRDTASEKRTLLVILGWQRGMGLHNLLILIGFLILGVAIVLGLPLRLAWPALLGLPVGLYQIWQINRLIDGGKPHWRLLGINAVATFALVAYLLAFSIWTG